MRDASVMSGVRLRGRIQPEVPSKVRGLEGYQIRGKEASQDMLPNRETTEDLRRREGYVEEESDRSIWKCLTEHLWHEH